MQERTGAGIPQALIRKGAIAESLSCGRRYTACKQVCVLRVADMLLQNRLRRPKFAFTNLFDDDCMIRLAMFDLIVVGRQAPAQGVDLVFDQSVGRD